MNKQIPEEKSMTALQHKISTTMQSLTLHPPLSEDVKGFFQVARKQKPLKHALDLLAEDWGGGKILIEHIYERINKDICDQETMLDYLRVVLERYMNYVQPEDHAMPYTSAERNARTASAILNTTLQYFTVMFGAGEVLLNVREDKSESVSGRNEERDALYHCMFSETQRKYFGEVGYETSILDDSFDIRR